MGFFDLFKNKNSNPGKTTVNSKNEIMRLQERIYPNTPAILNSCHKKNRLLSISIISEFLYLNVVQPGFEPGQTGPESVVLPLHH